MTAIGSDKSDMSALKHQGLRTMEYGDRTFCYLLCRVPNRPDQHKISIHLHPNGHIQVDAPENAPLADIKDAVYKRSREVIDHVDLVSEREKHILPREYVSGESCLYLGKRYLLKVIKSDLKSVKLLRGKLQVFSPDTSKEAVKSLLDTWYRDRAKAVFSKRLAESVKALNWLELSPDWKLLAMTRQWGSCSPKGVLSLNPHLVKAPTICIDYVLLHELCHLQEHNHSPKFYELLRRHMPTWESVKHRLDGMAEMMLNE